MMKSKQKVLLLSAALLTVAAIGAGAATTGYAASGSGLIGASKAKELAAKATAGQALYAELDKERGITYYDVDILKDNREYDVHIEAYTGKTLKIEREDRDDDDWDDNRRSVGGNPPASPPSPSAVKPGITAEQASRIAAERVDGTVVKAKLDKDDGVLLYEIELKTSRGEAEVDVHAQTGKILSVDYDDDDDLYDD